MVIITAMIFSLAAGKAIQIQAIDADRIAADAAKQITISTKLPALRGAIYDRNKEVLALTENTVTIIADPKLIRTNGKLDESMTDRDKELAAAAPGRIAELLTRYVGGSAEEYLSALTKEKTRYSIVAKQVSRQNYAQLRAEMADINEKTGANLIGLSTESAPARRYPQGTVAANVLGFVNAEGTGKGGVELMLNSALEGTDGSEVYEISPNGRIPTGSSVLVPAQNGQDYQLTLDLGLQLQVEQILADRVSTTRAKSGSAVVMNVKTGEVLALANYPTFDPNDVGSANQDNVGNRAITDPFTPGSVHKLLTFSAMIDAGVVRTKDVINLPASIKSGGKTIVDPWKHGAVKVYARGIVVKSSNVGTIMLSRKMDKDALVNYYKLFGLGVKTGIGLPGESAGVLPTENVADVTRDGMAFGGSGVSVTTIQEAAAIAAIANGGVYNPPQLLKAATDAQGNLKELPKAASHRVVSTAAAKEVVSMMEAMQIHARGEMFKIDGYRTGAKTGTTKKYNSECSCYKGYVTSTVGIAPVEDPQLLTYVVVDDPQAGSSGESVAGPAYQDIMTLALQRYGVKPSTKKAPSLPIFPPN
jgi:cell division protein FtsI (penicillin-binding protein 3)